MRQRGLKNRDSIIESCNQYIVNNPLEYKGKWDDLFPLKKDLYLEIGSGKGQFICNMAKRHEEYNFLACEGGYNIYPRILQKACEDNLDNFMAICEYIVSPKDYFNEGELKGVFLNFSDPWPKDRYAHRRLTHVNKLLEYKEIMKTGSTLEFKTDNDDLFTFSLKQVKLADLNLEYYSNDIHKDIETNNLLDGSIYSFEQTTEYEDKFTAMGKAIHYLRIRF